MSHGDAEDTLRMLGDAVASFAKPDGQRSRAARDQHHGCDSGVWQEMAAMGWLAATLPEDKGGLGLGLGPAAAIARRLGYAAHHEPFVAAGVMAVECLAACGPAAGALLGAVTEGGLMASLAWQPPDGQLEPEACAVTIARHGGKVLLSGECRFVGAPHADDFLVVAQGAGEFALYRVPRAGHLVAVECEPAADGSQLGRVTLSGVEPAPDALLAQGDAARAALERALAAGVLTTAAELLGVIERALELTLEHLRTRHQFGQAIGAFQALQHRAVDMWIQQQLTEAALGSALRAFDDPAAGVRARRLAASSAKARASQAALYVCGQAVQLHGAIGFTDECELGLHVNRALVLAARYGNAAWHRRRYAELATSASH